VPVAFSADSKLIRNPVPLLPELLDIQVMTRESESGESAQKMVKDILSQVRRKRWFGCAFLIVPPASVTPYAGIPKWVWYVLMTLLETWASCG